MKYKQYNDYELIYMVRENDDSSRDILYQKYIPIIHHLANNFYQTNKYYGYDFEDFLQEAVLAFYHALSSFQEDKDTLFYTFVILCIKRKLISFTNKISNKNSNLLLYDYVSIDELEIEDYRTSIDTVMNGKEVESIIKNFLYSLPFEKSCIFELKLNGFSYREISQLLDMPISSVEFKNRSSNIKIRDLLKDYYYKLNKCKEKAF